MSLLRILKIFSVWFFECCGFEAAVWGCIFGENPPSGLGRIEILDVRCYCIFYILVARVARLCLDCILVRGGGRIESRLNQSLVEGCCCVCAKVRVSLYTRPQFSELLKMLCLDSSISVASLVYWSLFLDSSKIFLQWLFLPSVKLILFLSLYNIQIVVRTLAH